MTTIGRKLSDIKGTLSPLVNFPTDQISPIPSKFYKKKIYSTLRVSSSGSFSPLSSFSSLLIFSTSACCLNNSASCLRDAIFTKCSSFIRLNSGSRSKRHNGKKKHNCTAILFPQNHRQIFRAF